MYSKYFRLARPFTQAFLPSGTSTVLNVNLENQPPKRWAGHSKWQNIKSTKAATDQKKSIAFQRLSGLIQIAVKENGPDVSTNSKLKALIDEAKKVSMPKSTIEKALKGHQTMSKPYWTVFSGPKGIVLGLEVVFQNNKPGYLVTKLSGQTKKIKLKMEPHFSHLCNERGIIVTDPLKNVENAFERALEDAIEMGIEEVHENDDKSLIFECSPERLDSCSEQLLKKGYNIYSSTTELEFKEFISLQEEEVKDIEKIISALQCQHEEVLRASYNHLGKQ